MENEKIKRITSFLLKHGEKPEQQSEERMEQFNKIDNAIQKRISEIKQAQDVLKGRPLNVQVIAENSGISRKTFYNNELLSLYIKEFEIPTIKPEKDQLKRSKDKCQELERQIHEFVLRDVETENLRQENHNLQLEIQHLHVQLKGMEEQIENLIKENDKLKGLSNKRSVIIPFNKEKKE